MHSSLHWIPTLPYWHPLFVPILAILGIAFHNKFAIELSGLTGWKVPFNDMNFMVLQEC
jgi:hypothetical protein